MKNCVKMKAFHKEKMAKCLEERQGNTDKYYQEINKTVQDQKLEIESIKKIQTEKILEMKI